MADHRDKLVTRGLVYNKHSINKSDFDLVWWDGAGNEMPDFPRMFRVFVIKQTSKFCGTNHQLSRYNETVANVCPSYNKDDESAKHIRRCLNPDRRKM